MKRFYKGAAVSPHANDFWQVTLDGKAVKTPTGKPLAVEVEAVAKRVRDEWEAQGEDILPDTMPLTRLANVAAERSGARDELVRDIVAYGTTDLLSYRKDSPEDFVARQSEAFDPILEWASEKGLTLRSTTGILAIEQDPLTLDRLGEHAGQYSALGLTLFAHLTATYGSAILALAVMQGALDPGEAYDISQTDERYQAEVWGEDEEATARAARIRAETVAMAAIVPDLPVPALDFPDTL